MFSFNKIKLVLLTTLTHILLFSAEPKVTILTYVYKGEKNIEHFLNDITKQTIYSDCEHILINADSPENEEPIILNYCKTYPNIRYLKLDTDPGQYSAWNRGLLMSKGKYITSAKLDFRYKHDSLEKLYNYIEENPDIDLVYSNILYTNEENKSFGEARTCFSPPNKILSIENLCKKQGPMIQPLWSKKLHEKFGLFYPNFRLLGDDELWLRATINGAKHKRLPEFTGIYYIGDSNVSLPRRNDRERIEKKLIQSMYRKHFKICRTPN
ncbi:MAG: hypothetical protein S4CHLAM37_13360 [Chlamydiia bacterium]|nr:hypothetical protein [Chlamydiia bacterium]